MAINDEFETNSIKYDINEDIKTQNSSAYKCLICDKSYKHYASFFKHKNQKHPNYDSEINIIKNKQKEDIVISQIKELLISQANKINELELIVQTSKSKTKSNNKTINNKMINTNSNNTNNGTINNINIIGFGRENINKLTDDEIKDILFTRNIDPICSIIKKNHFNERLPEQQNVQLTSINSKYAKIHNGDDWHFAPLNNVIYDLFDNNTYYLGCLIDNCSDKNKNKIKKSVQGTIDLHTIVSKLDEIEKKTNKDKIESYKNKNEEIKLLIHTETSKLQKTKQITMNV
jgi:hypothetical protein